MNISINNFTIDSLLCLIPTLIKKNEKVIVAHHNMHSLSLVNKDSTFHYFYSKAHYVHIDGMPLVFIGKILGHHLQRKHRITYVDFLPPLLCLANRNKLSICYIGSKPGVGECAAEILRKRYRSLKIATHHGFFDVNSEKDNEAVLNFIHKSKPQIIMVGMGMPRQEKWILSNFENFPDALIFPCGAAFDYEAGIVPKPPRWAGRFALEWLFRLFTEPKRLWSRYLVEPWSLAIPFAKEFWESRVRKAT